MSTAVLWVVRRPAAGLQLGVIALGWANNIEDVSGNTENGNSVSNSLGVLDLGLPGYVGDVVASGVVADIVCDTSLTTVGSGLLWGLDLLSSGEETTRCNTVLEERSIIGASGEISWEGLDAGGLEVVLEELLSLGRSDWAGGSERGSVTVVNTVEEVWRSNHVKVEIDADLVQVLLSGLLDEVSSTKQTLLLSGPPGEADGVVDLVLGQLLGDLKKTDGAGAVVVDTWAGLDGIGVASQVDDVVVVTSLGLSNDVGGGGDIKNDVDGSDLGLTSLDRCLDGLSVSVGDTNGGWVITLAPKSSGNNTGLVVVDDGPDGTSSLGVGSLSTESASSTLDQGNLARDASWEVSSVATKVGNVDNVLSDGSSSGEGHDLTWDRLAVDGNISGGGGDIEVLGVIGVVVIVWLQVVKNPLDGGLVSLRSDNTGTVASGELGKILKLVSKLLESLLLDVVGELFLGGVSLCSCMNLSRMTYGGNQGLLLWSWLAWLPWESVSTTVTTTVVWSSWLSVRTLQALSDGLAIVLSWALVWVGWKGRDNCGSSQSRGEDRKLHDLCVRGCVMRG